MPMPPETNMLLRSAYQVAIRQGNNTNWQAFTKSILKQLLVDSGLPESESDEQLILRATCTARTYRALDFPD